MQPIRYFLYKLSILLFHYKIIGISQIILSIIYFKFHSCQKYIFVRTIQYKLLQQTITQMLKLTAQMGSNPLRYHIPVRCKSTNNYLLTIGENGQIVGWKLSTLQPLYLIVCSALADTDGLIDLVITPLRLITNQTTTYKIVTVHNDDRIRIFTIRDGLCISVSQHAMLPEKIYGLVQNQHQTRFLMCFGQKKVYIIDSWTMKVVDSLQPKMDSYSILKKGRINAKMQLQLMDKQSKTYRLNMSPLFQQIHLDVGNWLNNPQKSSKFLYSAIQKIKSQNYITSYRKIVDTQYPEQLKIIEQKLKEIKSYNIWQDIVDVKYLNLDVIKYLLSLQDQQPVVSNCLFIKNSKLWYFFGTNKGRVLGIPAIVKQNQQVIVNNPVGQVNSTVAYMSSIQNLLIVSWQNGMFNIYTTDNLDYTIQTTITQQKQKNKQNPQLLKSKQNLFKIDLNQNKVVNEKLSAQIKYRLQIYSLSRGKVGTNLLAFQLMNNQVIVFDSMYRKLSHYRGVSQLNRIYAVLEMDDYYGIAHSKGIDIYSADRYQRTIQYQNWIWNDFQLCEQFKCKQDYHNIYSKLNINPVQADISQVNALLMFQHMQRFYRKKLDYYTPTLDLLYQTFGPLQSDQITNQLYPQIHFIQRVYSQRTIHSYCNQNSTSIIRLKHSNIRRQKLTNTTYLYSCNLNKQLQLFSNDKSIPIQQFQNNLGLFSLFFWDQDQSLDVGKKYRDCKAKFVLRRRYTQQGIGRSFTIYFDNKYKHELSPQLLTYSSIGTVAFLQVCSTKDIQLADEMVNAVQYFTILRKDNQIKVDVNTLSRLSISQSSFILKACINILMSTALTQIVPLHPINDYFLLNLKNIEQKNNILLTQTQTIWFVYLGIGFIYSNQQCDKEQVKKLIQRLIKTIDVKNFQAKPDLIQIVLKVFNQGVKKWKKLISSAAAMKLFADLFRIFFYYDGLTSVQPDDKKFNFVFEALPLPQNRKMKQQIIKTIIYVSKQFNNQFLQVIRIQALNQKPHSAYPASVIQILRQYIKAEKPQANLVFYVELLLQCLSPMTPQLRKHVQKNVLATLQLMCSYQNISFNHPSQKLSLRTDANIYIYCLRTSTKWRTISLKDEKNTEHSVLQMSPQGTYIALLGQRLRIWRLSNGFWSGVLGAFSQGWTFEVQGNDIKWDKKQQFITVINQNPSENKCFKL